MFYNAHIHTFNSKDVPNRFLVWPMVPLLKTKVGFWIITGFMKRLWPFSNNDVLDRYVKFVEINKLGDQKEIFEDCKRYYPSDTHFVSLSMDMAYMGAGKVKRDFKIQLEKLAEVSNNNPHLIPFVHIDPRRENTLELLKYAIEELNFKGVKMYPSLGYFPYDNRLDDIYSYCNDNNIPIITHGSPYNPVHYKGKKKQIKKWLKDAKLPVDYSKKSKKGLCSNFTNPLNWKFVVEKFPNLKICLAHFGSEYYWDKYLQNGSDNNNWFVIVKKLIQEYPNFYTDVSFTLNNKQFFPLLKIILENEKIREKTLFGSDFYMVETKSNERRFSIDLRAYLGENFFKAIAYDNPRKFLNINDNYDYS